MERGVGAAGWKIAFESSIPSYEGHAKTLVIHCSQHDYQLQIDDFVRNHLERESFDRLAVPGGPQVFLGIEHAPKFRWAGSKWAEFLIAQHHLNEVFLIAHEECGWYKSLVGAVAAQSLRERVIEDLRKVRGSLKSHLSKVDVQAFYAQPNERKRIQFLTVP